jgi:sterol desaturase/sphingolipid hydroxylase (fatty acid hydroxylase superfamily)
MKFVKWFFGYPGFILPWNAIYAAAGIVLWLYLTPPMETMKSFSADWIGYLLLRNAVIVFLFFGTFHFRLYIKRIQGNSFKFNAMWPSADNSAFLFRSQTIDNMIWTFASAVPLWTAYEALTLWAFANGYIPSVSFEEHPIYCMALFSCTG